MVISFAGVLPESAGVFVPESAGVFVPESAGGVVLLLQAAKVKSIARSARNATILFAFIWITLLVFIFIRSIFWSEDKLCLFDAAVYEGILDAFARHKVQDEQRSRL